MVKVNKKKNQNNVGVFIVNFEAILHLFPVFLLFDFEQIKVS